MTESSLNQIAQELTLPLSPGNKPFALEGREEHLGPDDWAWLFLRLNTEYRKAFEEHTSNPEDQRLASHLVNAIDNQSVRYDLDGSCSHRFGLSAWLNPELPFLPALKNGGSWFFPLKRPILEDPLRTEVSTKPYIHSKHPFSDDADAHPYALVNETPFGFRARGKVEYPRARDSFVEAYEKNVLPIAVDCSIPPNGQMSAIRQIAEITRKHLRKHGAKTHDKKDCYQVVDIHACDTFSAIKFKTSAGNPHSTTEFNASGDLSGLWCVVSIDALGPLTSQTNAIRPLLKKRYIDNVNAGIVTPSTLPEPFPTHLPTCTVDGIPSNGGNYLKALLIIAELNEKFSKTEEFVETKIIKVINAGRSNKGYANTWRATFENNIQEKYIDLAQQLINGGYKWLVHTQKPQIKQERRPALKTRFIPNSIKNRMRTRPEWD
ncbi:MAG: hypothetical protein KGM99_16165 [Burkholderiales bacterium]|nr:hypothetical protein [Burkholderiales bacterium]